MADTDDLDDMDPETLAAILKGIDEVDRELGKLREEMRAAFGETNSLLSGLEAAVLRLTLVSGRRSTQPALTPEDIPGETAAEKLLNLLKQMYPQYSQPEQP